MRMLILGASGGCGRWATRLAAAEGHAVTAMVRPSTPFEAPPQVTVVRADPLDPAQLSDAIENHEAVISCIGPQRINPRNPWSPLRAPSGCAEQAARSLLAATAGSGIRRIAVISAGGVGDSAAALNTPMRWLLRHSTLGAMYADLEAMETLLAQSERDWLAVRPVTLVNAPPSNRARALRRYHLTSIVGRADVAGWMLRWASGAETSGGRTPLIGWW